MIIPFFRSEGHLISKYKYLSNEIFLERNIHLHYHYKGMFRIKKNNERCCDEVNARYFDFA